MLAAEIREKYLQFFESKGHLRLPSASLIPHNDPSLLLTAAGMVPFKPYFLGRAEPPRRRVTTAQKCVRTPDIDNVGKTARHLTFFEMLGNFSFGDYFKTEAIAWAWEFVTQVLQLPKEKLRVTIYLDDDEAFRIWNQAIGVPAEHIFRLGKDTNFWEIGVGPCGPCSEIFVDRGPGFCSEPDCDLTHGCDRWLEIWNLVFIQFHRDENGQYQPLERKSIDTGMGLERVAALMQGVPGAFDTDLLRPVVDKAAGLAHVQYGQSHEADVALRVIADHARSVTFMVGDGILPSNEGRGYVLRRLLRRGLRYGRNLGLHGPFFASVCGTVIDKMASAYPELEEKRSFILKIVAQEEERFQATLDQGSALLDEILDRLARQGQSVVSGQDAFRLYDTYGFPLELTREIAAERGMQVHTEGFQEAMRQQKERARSARQETNYVDVDTDKRLSLAAKFASRFVGYDTLESHSTVLALLRDGQEVAEAQTGESVDLILDKTPFYASGGGQVADTGTITAASGQLTVEDVERPAEGLIVHRGKVTSGVLRTGDQVLASVYAADRAGAARNHSATHLLQAALRQVLGKHVHQAGSLVTPQRLRFDFTHFQPLSPDELARVEDLVNEWVVRDDPVQTLVTSRAEAEKMDVMALFEAKYGEQVRVVSMGEYSRELCGGTHVGRTGMIGLFQVVSEGAVAAGVRRIEAVTGPEALRWVRQQQQVLHQAARLLGVGWAQVYERTEHLLQENQELGRQLAAARKSEAQAITERLAQQAAVVGGARVLVATVENVDPESLRRMGDELKARLAPAVVVLGTVSQGKALFLAMVTPDLVQRGLHAGELVRKAAQIAGGGGGGRPDMAQAGGRNPERLGEALDSVRQEAVRRLGA
ncbi:MAG: alanine--tRNA ligase [Firmicutes bacterium]|nr:alanine--tRNA ligase [Bacillota bacterium]